jgi:hypothetical protein
MTQRRHHHRRRRDRAQPRRSTALQSTSHDEAVFLKSAKADLVLGDIPPLAHGCARLQSIAVSNFTWDWIYEGCETFERDARCD